MNKQNDTLKNLKNQDIQKIFHKFRRQLIRELEKSKIICRKRKIMSYDTLVTAAYLYIVNNLSFRRLAYRMQISYRVDMSATAWKNQLSKLAPALLNASQNILNRQMQACGIPRTVALDATHFSVEGGKGEAIRVHTGFSLDSHSAEQLHITTQHTPESVINFDLHENTCYLADRAYGSAKQIAYMLNHKANFIFRISPAQIRLYLDMDCQKKIDFTHFIHGEKFSVPCFLQYNHKVYRIYAVGSKLPPDKQNDAQKRAKRKAQKNQYHASERKLLFANWLIAATSIPNKEQEIYEMYRLRWQIEIFFKTAKSLLNFHRLRRSTLSYKINTVSLWQAFVQIISSLLLFFHSNAFLLPSTFYSFSFLLSFFS